MIKVGLIQNCQMMIEPYSTEIETQMQELYSRLSEKSRRLYAGVEALKLGYGGVSYIASLYHRLVPVQARPLVKNLETYLE